MILEGYYLGTTDRQVGQISRAVRIVSAVSAGGRLADNGGPKDAYYNGLTMKRALPVSIDRAGTLAQDLSKEAITSSGTGLAIAPPSPHTRVRSCETVCEVIPTSGRRNTPVPDPLPANRYIKGSARQAAFGGDAGTLLPRPHGASSNQG